MKKQILIFMKKLIAKFSLMTALCAVAVSSVSCKDDKGSAKPKFTSDLIGTYTPTYVSREAAGGETNDFYLTFEATWVDPENIPMIDLTAVMGFPIPMNTVLSLVEAMGSNIVKGGLVEVELKNDGSFGAKYHDLLIEGSDMSSILGALLAPQFGSETKQFPGSGSSVLPSDAVGYYTKDGKFYFTLSRSFLKGVASDMDIVTLLDGLLAQYPSIGIVSTEDYYAVPLKYTKENGVVTLYVDRDMMVPVMDVLAPLLGALGPDTTMGIDLGQVLKDLKEQTTAIEIAVRLK